MRPLSSCMLFLVTGLFGWDETTPLNGQRLKDGGAREAIDRGLVASRLDADRVYLAWRLLASDPPSVSFNVYRRIGNMPPAKINQEPIRQTTDLVDSSPGGSDAAWFVRPVVDSREGPPSAEAKASAEALPYRSIRLQGNYWREEIITSVPGEMRIYTSRISAADRRACLMQDPIYRIDVAHAAMGYYQVPMLSYDPATAARASQKAGRNTK